MKKNLIFLILATLLVSCTGEEFKESQTFIGNKTVDAATLNLGKQVYREYCMACHGADGGGNGVSSKGMIPAPRNLKQGLYKFGWVVAGELPTDEDFHRIIRYGLKGTAMLPWDIQPKQLDAVTQYIKTFAPQVWKKEGNQIGEQLQLTKDPYGLARKESAIQHGKEVYHAVANCYSCHRAYATKQEIYDYTKKALGQGLTDLGDDIYELKLQVSDHIQDDGVVNKYLPPDFTWHEVRSATTVEELYLRLVSGVGGAAMPSWKGVLEDDQIWALAYYVRSLMDLKNNPDRNRLMDNLKNQPAAIQK